MTVTADPAPRELRAPATWRLFLRHRGARWGLAMAALVVLIAEVGRLVSDDPDTPDYAAQLLSPRAGHWLGTDASGRDLFARTAAGTWTSLSAAVIVTALTISIGLAVGVVAGYLRGPVDAVISRLIDMMLGLPELVISLAIVGALGVGHWHLVLALSVTGWAYLARISRSLVLGSHGRLDVVSARLAGVPSSRILRQHVMPPVLTQLLVIAASRFGTTVLALASLAFLGLGAQPPASELGQMLADATGDLGVAPWLVIGPTVVIALTVGAAMLLSDALRDTLDPGSAEAFPPPRRRWLPTRHPARPLPEPAVAVADDHVLQLDELSVTYPDATHAIRGVSLALAHDECLAIVGESGCGKSTLARALLGVLPEGTRVDGVITIGGRDLAGLPEKQLRPLRGPVIGYVAQDPYAACDPLRSVGDHVAEAWRAHGSPVPDVAARVERLGVDDAASRLRERPHQWSGGMLQRATIAAAAAHQPAVIVADEPSSALDAELADGVLEALRVASRSLVLISHDLHLVERHADRAAVMYAGRVVEVGPATELLTRPRHPYTQALLDATPRPGHRPRALVGSPPVLREPVADRCAFTDRCAYATDVCRVSDPPLVAGLACWNPPVPIRHADD